MAPSQSTGFRCIGATGGIRGDDEFALPLAHMDTTRAGALIADLREAVSSAALQANGELVHPAISIGIAPIDESTPSGEAALIEVDRSMYADKRRRKMGVQHAEVC